MPEFSPPLKYNDRGQKVKDAQWILQHNRFHRNFYTGAIDGIFGRQCEAASDEARYILGFPADVVKSHRFGQELYDYLRVDGHADKLPRAYLQRRIARLAKERTHQIPGLPGRVWFPGVAYPPGTGKYGLQPWIVPQVEAICKRFGLQVTAGWGGHPPHAVYSDHRWGGAVDLAGQLQHMIDACFWGDSLCSGFYHKGKVFRWVGGPAHDANGIEPGHYNHTHLSWYRRGPATTIFGTPGSGFPR